MVNVMKDDPTQVMVAVMRAGDDGATAAAAADDDDDDDHDDGRGSVTISLTKQPPPIFVFDFSKCCSLRRTTNTR